MEDYNFEETELPAFNYYLSHEEPEDEYVGGIHTRFYDESGSQVYEIPAIVHKVFNEEYGIKLKYNKEHEMLYYAGSCEPAYEKTSPLAVGYWKKELSRFQVSKGKLLFGFSYAIEIKSYPEYDITDIEDDIDLYDDDGNCLSFFYKKDVQFGVVPGIPYINTRLWKMKDLRKRKSRPPINVVIGDIACIDLHEFSDDLNLKNRIVQFTDIEHYYKIYELPLPKFDDRTMNLARVLEHEFIAHALNKYSDQEFDMKLKGNEDMSDEEWTEKKNDIILQRQKLGPVPTEAFIGNPIRRELLLPDRLDYQGSSISISLTKKTIDEYSLFTFGYLDMPKEYLTEKNQFHDPPLKYPEKMWDMMISKEDIPSIIEVKYTIQLRYDIQKKIYSFV